MAPKTQAKKDHRVELRATPRQKKLIWACAKKRGVTLSQFILNSAVKEAAATISEEREFSLSKAKWEEFTTALDSPPVKKARLAKLMRSK